MRAGKSDHPRVAGFTCALCRQAWEHISGFQGHECSEPVKPLAPGESEAVDLKFRQTEGRIPKRHPKTPKTEGVARHLGAKPRP